MRQRRNEGFALLIVLWVMVLITIVTLDFSLSSRREVQLTSNYFKYTEVNYGAKSALTSMINYIITNFYTAEFFRSDVNKSRLFFEKLKGGYAHIKIVDEGRKVNVNKMSPGNLLKVFRGKGIEDDESLKIIDCIYDWIDRDNLHRLNGAEDDYYESLEIPYEAKDAPLTTIFELLLVKGITPEMFYGSNTGIDKSEGMEEIKKNSSLYQVVPLETEEEMSEDISDKEGFIDYLRVSDNIIINRASRGELRSLGFSKKLVKRIARQLSSVRSSNDLIGIIGSGRYNAIKDRIEILNNNVFNIMIEAESDDGSVINRIYAKVLFDPKTEQKFNILNFKEGF